MRHTDTNTSIFGSGRVSRVGTWRSRKVVSCLQIVAKCGGNQLGEADFSSGNRIMIHGVIYYFNCGSDTA